MADADPSVPQAPVLALDVGTTAVKAALVAADLTVAATASAPLDTDRAGDRVEQAPGEWWEASCQAVRAVVDPWRGPPPAVLAITGQMQNLVPLHGEAPVGRAILYADHRAGREHEQLVAEIGDEQWFALTGNVQDPSNLAAKLRWLDAHEPERLRAADRLLFGAHSFVALRATGAVGCDRTTASTTGLYELARQDWSPALVTAAGVDPGLLPPLVDPTTPFGALRPRAAAELGLPAGLPVVHSAGDAGAATVGVGIDQDGGRYAYLGTSGWLAASMTGPPAPRRELFTIEHPVPGHVIQVGPMLSVGSCVDWVRGVVTGAADHTALEVAVAAAPTPSGLLFLPYLAGERSPFHDPAARGAFIGLSHTTTPGQMLKATLEGVALSLAAIGDVLDAGVDPPSQVPLRLTGGGSRSAAWRRIIADVFGQPVARVAAGEHVGVLGAAWLAGTTAGWAPGERPRVAVVDRCDPDPEATKQYRQIRRLHEQAYPCLRDIFHALHPAGAPSPGEAEQGRSDRSADPRKGNR